MEMTDEIEKALNGRWVTQDKNTAFFFAFLSAKSVGLLNTGRRPSHAHLEPAGLAVSDRAASATGPAAA